MPDASALCLLEITANINIDVQSSQETSSHRQHRCSGKKQFYDRGDVFHIRTASDDVPR